MRIIELRDVRRSLDTAIAGRRCVEAWLGYGQVLFLGFDDQANLVAAADSEDVHSPYCLQTVFADWTITRDDRVLGTVDDDATKAEAAARELLGQRAIRWAMSESTLWLEIDFDHGLQLRIAPRADNEANLHRNAWVLAMPDGCYQHVRWDGTAFILHEDEPCSNEPPPL